MNFIFQLQGSLKVPLPLPSSRGGTVLICDEELSTEEFTLAFETIGSSPSMTIGAGEGLAILDAVVTSELELEGLARDIVRMIQQARKTAGLHVSDRIVVDIDADEKLTAACQNYEVYIKEQVLAHRINYGSLEGDYVLREEHQIEGNKAILWLTR